MHLEGVSAIVTGGASGLGAATVRRLARKGARVVIADLQVEAGTAIAEEVDGGFVQCDVTDEEQVRGAITSASRMGPLRVLVNCAGIGPPQRTLARDGTANDLGHFQKIIGINLVGTFNAIRLAAEEMATTEPLDDSLRVLMPLRDAWTELANRETGAPR